ATGRTGCGGVRDQPGKDIRIGRQLEVSHAGVVGEAEVVTGHAGPDRHGVVGDVLLVDVAVAREEVGRPGHELADGQVGQAQSDQRVDPRALLGIDVDV